MSKELIDAVLEWWKDHEYDVLTDEDDERNMYNEDPEFVRIAKKLRNMKEKRGEA